MWTISGVKEHAKAAFHKNYWKAVLMALILSVIGGSAGGASGGFTGGIQGIMNNTGYSQESSIDSKDDYSFNIDDDDFYIDDDGNVTFDEDAIKNDVKDSDFAGLAAIVMLVLAFAMVILIIVLVFVILMQVFLLNPLSVGIHRFWYRNLSEKAEVKEIGYAFDHSYKNAVKVSFFMDLYLFLWSLLFVIPGIYKSYEYRMIPYLLAEYPDMPKEDAFAISRYMMDGNKWRAFLFDLSFIGWFLLAMIPFVGTFYVNPYYYQASAALYDAIKFDKRPFARVEAPTNGPAPAGGFQNQDFQNQQAQNFQTADYAQQGQFGNFAQQPHDPMAQQTADPYAQAPVEQNVTEQAAAPVTDQSLNTADQTDAGFTGQAEENPYVEESFAEPVVEETKEEDPFVDETEHKPNLTFGDSENSEN